MPGEGTKQLGPPGNGTWDWGSQEGLRGGEGQEDEGVGWWRSGVWNTGRMKDRVWDVRERRLRIISSLHQWEKFKF